MISPKKFFQELKQNFQAWLFYTRLFRRIAERTAGAYYNCNRHAIKHEIRERVAQVMKGWDLACQTQLFSSTVAELAENSRRMELRGKCSGKGRVMA